MLDYYKSLSSLEITQTALLPACGEAQNMVDDSAGPSLIASASETASNYVMPIGQQPVAVPVEDDDLWWFFVDTSKLFTPGFSYMCVLC